MRKCRFLSLFLVLLLLLTGCGNTYSPENNQQLYGVSMRTKLEEYSQFTTLIDVVWENNTDKTLRFGNYFRLEKNVNNQWEKIYTTYPVGFRLVAFLVAPHSQMEHTYDISVYTDDILEVGRYRIITTVEYARGPGDFDRYIVYAEFTVTDCENNTDSPTNNQQLYGVSMRTTMEVYSPFTTHIDVVWENNTDKTLTFGEFFRLEKNVNNQWEKIYTTYPVGFTFLGFLVAPHSQREHTYNISIYTDGILEVGRYRIITTFDHVRGSGDFGSYIVYAEFTVTNS